MLWIWLVDWCSGPADVGERPRLIWAGTQTPQESPARAPLRTQDLGAAEVSNPATMDDDHGSRLGMSVIYCS